MNNIHKYLHIFCLVSLSGCSGTSSTENPSSDSRSSSQISSSNSSSSASASSSSSSSTGNPGLQTLHQDAAWPGWYTESVYSPVDSFNDALYFVMLGQDFFPYVGVHKNEQTQISRLDDSNYQPYDDGHHEYSIGIDKEGYIHVAGDMHNFPAAEVSNTTGDYANSTALYWVSENPEDISAFKFVSEESSQLAGSHFSYGHFVTDRNGELYFVARCLARRNYYQHGGRGLCLMRYNPENKTWTALGEEVPKSDASNPVIVWEESGRDGTSYQMYKADLFFDENNRMHLAVAQNSDDANVVANNILYAYSDDGGNTFKKINGEVLSFPIGKSNGAEIVSSSVSASYGQASISVDNQLRPIIHYQRSGTGYISYWDGNDWTEFASSVNQDRAKLLYSEFTDKMYLLVIHSGDFREVNLSEQSTSNVFNLGYRFRYVDRRGLRSRADISGLAWAPNTGDLTLVRYNFY